MIINNTATLLDRMQAGDDFKLDKKGNLQTMDSMGGIFQKIGDIFRSQTSIATRNERLSMKMASLLDSATAAPENLGPTNLAEATPMTAAEKTALLNHVKATVLEARVSTQVAVAHPQMPLPMRNALVAAVLKDIRSAPDYEKIAASPNKLSFLVGTHLKQIAAARPQLMASLGTLASGFTVVQADLPEKVDQLKNTLTSWIKQDRVATKKEGDVMVPKKFTDHVFNDTGKDIKRNFVSINGAKLAGTQDAMVNTYLAKLVEKCPNTAQREVVSWLCCQSTTAAFMGMVSGTENPINPYVTGSNSTLIPGMDYDADMPPVDMSWNEAGDTILNFNFKLTMDGKLDGESVLPAGIEKGVDVGTMTLTIKVPNEQPAATENPIFSIENLNYNVTRSVFDA